MTNKIDTKENILQETNIRASGDNIPTAPVPNVDTFTDHSKDSET